jgi:DNA-binding response OmpR family regulator
MRLLVVEDDTNLGEQLQYNLHSFGHVVDLCTDALNAGYLVEEIEFDAIILDLGLPDQNGLDLLKQWREQHNHTPVLILTARNEWEEKVRCFKAGADDYLCKPFHHEELLARLEALVRRRNPHLCPQLQSGGISLDSDNERALIISSNQFVSLTAMEFRLLQHFIRNPGRLISKQQLLDQLYQFDEEPSSNIVESYIRRLRQKFGKQIVETKRFQGYIYRGLP